MLTRLVLLAFLMLPLEGMAQHAAIPIEINVKHANVQGLVIRVSDASRQDVAIGGFADKRISLSATYPSYSDFVTGIAKLIGGTVVSEGSVPIVIDACIGDRPSAAKRVPHLRPLNISLSFARMDPVGIFNVIYGLDADSADESERVQPGQYGLIGVRVKDAPLNLVHQLLSRASGIDIVDDGGGNLSVRRRSTCASKSHESNEAPLPQLMEQPCQRNLPPLGDAKDAKCEPLEFYKLENIVLQGYVRSNGRTIAIAETPDGLTWPIASGDYIGKDYGRVKSVSTNAVVIRELVKNPYGYIYEQTIQIDYQNNRRPQLAE